jgi:hypothetical protein
MMLKLVLFLLLQTASKGSIEGTVVRTGTRQPVDEVRVVLQMSRAEEAFDFNRPPPLYSMSTDAQGKFSFKNLEAGSYRMSFSANGYVTQEFGQRLLIGEGSSITLAEGQVLKDLVREMTPTGTVTGTIRDGDKQPLSGVPVRLMRVSYDYEGDRRLKPFGVETRTDDRGEFRIYFVTPGRYYLNAGTPQGPTGNGDPKLSANEVQVNYSYVYYPGVADLKFATEFEVEPGSAKVGMDLTVTRLPGVRVRGRIIDSVTGQAPDKPKVRLNYRDPGTGWDYDLEYLGREKVTYKDGNFEFRNVLPGLFTVSASMDEPGAPPPQPGMRAPQPKQRMGLVQVEVGSKDVEGIVVTISPGTTVSGRYRLEGGGNLGVSENSVVGIRLIPSSNGEKPSVPGIQPPTFGSLNSDGTFRIENVMPGEFRLEVGKRPQHYVKEARFGSHDLLQSPFQFTGREQGTLEIVVSPNSASVDGVVLDRQAGVRGAQVVLVPDRARFRYELFKSATTDQNGRFTLPNVSPGDYKVYAWESIEPYAWFDPEVLKKYEQFARLVHLTESAKQTVEPRLIPAGQ